MDLARMVATRSTCTRRQVGAVLVRDKRILATGYNGAPSGMAHCSDIGCLREAMGIPSGERQELCRGLHAEQNCLVQCSRYGISSEGATIYTSLEPCITCTKMIINAGIKRVVFIEPYPDELARAMRQESGIEVTLLEEDGTP